MICRQFRMTWKVCLRIVKYHKNPREIKALLQPCSSKNLDSAETCSAPWNRRLSCYGNMLVAQFGKMRENSFRRNITPVLIVFRYDCMGCIHASGRTLLRLRTSQSWSNSIFGRICRPKFPIGITSKLFGIAINSVSPDWKNFCSEITD